MATEQNKSKRFSARLEVFGDNAPLIQKGLESKMKAESRKTYTNAIEAALVEYFSDKTKNKTK